VKRKRRNNNRRITYIKQGKIYNVQFEFIFVVWIFRQSFSALLSHLANFPFLELTIWQYNFTSCYGFVTDVNYLL